MSKKKAWKSLIAENAAHQQVRRPLDVDQGYGQIDVDEHQHKACKWCLLWRTGGAPLQRSVQRRADEEV